MMKTSKQILLITLILFIFFASGCSKNFFGGDDAGPDSNIFGMAGDLEEIEEKSGGVDSSSGKETPGSGASGVDSSSGKEMPGNGASGVDSSSGKEMPGNGATGSFSAEPFAGDQGQEGKDLLSAGGDKAPGAGAEFLQEKNLREGDPSFAPDWKFSPGQSFGSAEQGMPGNGSTGSFSAEPFAGEGEGLRIDGSDTKETPEPFLTEKGEDMVASLPQGEQARRSLPYHPIDHLTDIHFAFDKYDLDDESRAILQENVAYLKTHPASRIEVRGHCDERGSNSYNISLGERRVQSTKSYLTSLGVDASRIRTISYGEERPFCFESNEACWYQNRRAHFLVAD